MNKQDEAKAKEILKTFNFRGSYSGDKVYGFTLDRMKQMAAWKEQQMIEYLYKNVQSLLEYYGLSEVSADITTQLFLEDFKKATKGE